MCKGLYKHYTYPNGKTVHLYQTDELYELLVDTTVQVCLQELGRECVLGGWLTS